jgi:uroporphyrinogen-III synthase
MALESRRAVEMAQLIRRQGGDPFVAPSVCEAPIEEGAGLDRFAERLFAGDFDMMMLLTGVGTRQLNRWLSARFSESAFAGALRRLTVAARGPKPLAALRELGVTPAVIAPEPNTWRELVAATEGRPERRIAVQEYGRANPELLEALRARGAEPTAVRVYQYALPEDAGPLREAAVRLAAGEFDVALFTTGVQIGHLARVAGELGCATAMLAGLRRTVIGSIGPTTSEALEEFELRADLEPSHPKMGLLVRETAERAHELIRARA